MRVENSGTVIICVYVDIMILVRDKVEVEVFKTQIKRFFNRKEVGTLDEYVGCKVTRKGNGLDMFQPGIIYKLKKVKQTSKRCSSTRHQTHQVLQYVDLPKEKN